MTLHRTSPAEVIPVDHAVGTLLAHDITEIRPGRFKGVAFKKGHIVREEDLEHLKRLGKEHLYVLHIRRGEVHEDDAALRLSRVLAGPGVCVAGPPSEGKISLAAELDGLLKVDTRALTELCLLPDMCCASKHTNTLVRGGETVAAARAIPLVIAEDTLERAETIARSETGVFSVKPLSHPTTGIVITGNEVFYGRIDDKFGPVLRRKMRDFGCDVLQPLFRPDDRARITEAVTELLTAGARLILVAGGMSVDPDDVTRLAIADAGAEDIVYGTPVLPGAMFLYGRMGDVPILGLPACVLFYRATVLDICLPRVLAGEPITRRDLAELAHGGLCHNCETCRFPLCPFGR